MKFICPKCSKDFQTPQALRMHDMRVHTGEIKVPGQAGSPLKPKPALVLPAKNPKSRKGTVPWTEDEVALLFVIAEQYKRGKHIDWERAFLEHPEYEADLGNRGRALLAQKLAYEKGKQPKKPRAIGGGAYEPWTPEEEVLLLQIVREYGQGGNVRWMQAFREHPEWHTQLKNRSTLTLGSKINRLKAAGKLGSQVVQAIQTRPRPRQNAIPAAPETNGEPVKVFKIDYCPHCGEHIQKWNYVAEVISTLPK